jgi:glycosyltransferase involved in cell wall biosynthesis
MSNISKSPVRLSVIIPCFNGGKTLALQLEALSSQQWHKEWEVIFADNGSTDNSRQVAESFQAKLPNLRIIDAGEKRGVAHARNVAIQWAKSDRFAFCDTDDQVGNEWVSHIGDALGKFDVVVSQFDDHKLNQRWFRELWNTSTDGPQPILGFLPGAAGYGLGFTRQVYERVGSFDESMLRMSDIDYTWRIQLAGFKLQFLPNAVVHYRHRVMLKEIFLRAYRDGQAQVQLYKKYREHGMSWKSCWDGVIYWMRMTRRLPQLQTRKGRWDWVIDAGFMLGRLRGSMKYGVVAL